MHLRTASAALTIAACLVLLGGNISPASADSASGGGKSCGPDQQVRISATTSGGTATFLWVTKSGQLGQSSKTGTSVTVYTGTRSITSWGVSNSGTIKTAGVACS